MSRSFRTIPLMVAAVTGQVLADPTPPTANPDALRGPRINDAAPAPTLVERDFEGRVRPLEADPVQVALERLTLDAPTLDRCRKIIDERNAILDHLVENNLKEIVALANARKAGDREESRRLFRALYHKADPLVRRGPLIEELAPLLPADRQAKVRALVDEYHAALADEHARHPEMEDDRLAGLPERSREIVADFGREIRASYERVFGQRRERFKRILGELSLTPEQDAQIQRIVLDSFQKSGGNPAPAETSRTFFEVYQLLNAEQRAILLEKMRDSLPKATIEPVNTNAAEPAATAPAAAAPRPADR